MQSTCLLSALLHSAGLQVEAAPAWPAHELHHVPSLLCIAADVLRAGHPGEQDAEVNARSTAVLAHVSVALCTSKMLQNAEPRMPMQACSMHIGSAKLIEPCSGSSSSTLVHLHVDSPPQHCQHSKLS